MLRLQGLADRLSALLLRMVAADIVTLEQDIDRRIQGQIAELQAEGKHAQAERLRALTDVQQLEAPKRGRPRKAEGGEA